jgi:4-hydroxybenzoyl-CoA thioesterase
MLKTYAIVGIPMVDTRARFLAPSKFGDDIVVESRIAEWRRSSFDVQHKVFKGDVLAVECSETRVWAVRSKTDPEAIEGQPVPQDVIARFATPPKS